ncbi:hypothetical protein JTB14_018935 [Gonioctena quinquepunctata]|nr:hypothetical protein JTB14_018935 [Gonioctena quinquepunctata]
MASVLSGYTDKFCKVYTAALYIVCWSGSVPVFGEKELQYLGRVVSESGNSPQEEHVMNTVNFTKPRSIKQLRGFLETAGWLREYIPRFAEIAAPLTDMIDKKKRFTWSEEAEKAFQKIEELVSKPLELAMPVFLRRFCIQSDASHIVIG